MNQGFNEFDEGVLNAGLSVRVGHPEENFVEVFYDECKDIDCAESRRTPLKFTGRFLRVKVALSNVCGNRNIALGVMLLEKVGDAFITKDMRVCEIPGSDNSTTPEIRLKEFCFIIPDEDMCNTRHFHIRAVAHYSSFE